MARRRIVDDTALPPEPEDDVEIEEPFRMPNLFGGASQTVSSNGTQQRTSHPRPATPPPSYFSTEDDDELEAPQTYRREEIVEPTNLESPFFSGQPANYRVKVQRRGTDGTIEDLGHLAINAGDEQLIQTYQRPGSYLLSLVDDLGVLRSKTPRVINLSPEHPAFRRLQAAQTQTSSSSSSPVIPNELLEMMKSTIEASQRREAELTRLLREQEEKVSRERAQMAQERIRMAEQSLTSGFELQSQLIERAQKREDMGQMQIVAVMQQAATAQQAAMMQQLEILKHEGTLERERIKAQADMERLRWEKEKEDARLRADADREREREREDRLREDAKHQLEIYREHQRAMETVRGKQQDTLGNLTSSYEKISPLLELFRGKDSEPAEPAQPKGLMDVVAMGIQSFMAMQAELQKTQMILAANAGRPPQIPQQMGPEEDDGYEYEDEEAEEAPQAVHGQVIVPPSSPMTAAQIANERAKDIDIKTCKSARRALRTLVEELDKVKAEQGKWPGLIMAAVSTEPAIVAYVTAVGLHTAALEAGADMDFANLIIAAINNTGALPASIPRN